MEYQDRDGKTQTSWYRCGSAFQDDNGRITVRIAMLPVAQNGELKLMLMEPKGNGPTGGTGGGSGW
jgi:hypothetical protein